MSGVTAYHNAGFCRQADAHPVSRPSDPGGVPFAAGEDRLASRSDRFDGNQRAARREGCDDGPERSRSGMDLELEGKVCVVTGASKGIGLAITRALVAERAIVGAGARTIDSLHGIEGVTPVAVDLGSPDGPAQLVKRAVDDHGRIDVLVNNVGGVRLRLEDFWARAMRSSNGRCA